jgi:PASTA domain
VRRTLTVLVLVLMISLTGCATIGRPTVATTPIPSPTPTLLTVPGVVGQNAAVAVDELRKAGFTNIDLGTVDGRRVVLLPQNWTVKAQSAKAGSHLAPDAKIVLGCARIGRARLL